MSECGSTPDRPVKAAVRAIANMASGGKEMLSTEHYNLNMDCTVQALLYSSA